MADADRILRSALQRLHASQVAALRALEASRYTHPLLTDGDPAICVGAASLTATGPEQVWSARIATMEHALQDVVEAMFLPGHWTNAYHASQQLLSSRRR